MPRGRNFREKRRRVFVACEGESERGYVAFVNQLVEEVGLPLHLDIRLCKGGDPLAIVERAVDEISRRASRRGRYVERAIFLDGDKRREAPDRTMQADRLIEANGLRPVWSQPALEALLLRHLPGCESLRPPTSGAALRELNRRWPEYVKGMAANEIRRRLDLSAVKRAAAVEPELRSFLTAIGILP